MRLSWFVTTAFAVLGLLSVPADAQYIALTTAGACGGACTNGTYAWPDSSGYLLKCVSGVWTKVTEGGTADYNGTSCLSPYFLAGREKTMGAICRKPYSYTILAGNTNNTQTRASHTYNVVLEGAMTPVTTAATQGLNETTISRAA